MKEIEKLESTSEQKKFSVFNFWDRIGINATQRLIESRNITPDQHILEIGCGTGYTSCLLAKNYQVDKTSLRFLSYIGYGLYVGRKV